jgi:hypothetical protein
MSVYVCEKIKIKQTTTLGGCLRWKKIVPRFVRRPRPDHIVIIGSPTGRSCLAPSSRPRSGGVRDVLCDEFFGGRRQRRPPLRLDVRRPGGEQTGKKRSGLRRTTLRHRRIFVAGRRKSSHLEVGICAELNDRCATRAFASIYEFDKILQLDFY